MALCWRSRNVRRANSSLRTRSKLEYAGCTKLKKTKNAAMRKRRERNELARRLVDCFMARKKLLRSRRRGGRACRRRRMEQDVAHHERDIELPQPALPDVHVVEGRLLHLWPLLECPDLFGDVADRTRHAAQADPAIIRVHVEFREIHVGVRRVLDERERRGGLKMTSEKRVQIRQLRVKPDDVRLTLHGDLRAKRPDLRLKVLHPARQIRFVAIDKPEIRKGAYEKERQAEHKQTRRPAGRPRRFPCKFVNYFLWKGHVS